MNNSSDQHSQTYPGGADHPGYRLAFRVWMIFFLLLISVALLNYMGTVLGWGR